MLRATCCAARLDARDATARAPPSTYQVGVDCRHRCEDGRQLTMEMGARGPWMRCKLHPMTRWGEKGRVMCKDRPAEEQEAEMEAAAAELIAAGRELFAKVDPTNPHPDVQRRYRLFRRRPSHYLEDRSAWQPCARQRSVTIESTKSPSFLRAVRRPTWRRGPLALRWTIATRSFV